MKNINGDSRIIFPWILLIVLVMGGVVVFSVLGFYSGVNDKRIIESEILASRTAQCLTNEGIIKSETLRNVEIKLNSCALNTEKLGEGGNFLKITITDNYENVLNNTELGKPQLLMQCELNEENKKYSEFAKCSRKIILAQNELGKELTIKIIAASAKK